MKREIYEAMKARIKPVDEPGYFDEHPEIPRDCQTFRFFADGLNENKDYDFIFDIVQAFRTKNIWNVAQRFYKELNWMYMNFDKRLWDAISK